MTRHTTVALVLAFAIGCGRPPPVVDVPILPNPPEAPTASATAAAPEAPPPVAPPASPFVVVSPHLGPRSVFEMEEALLASAGNDIFELVGRALRSRFDLAVGIPSDDCQAITGIVGRFPDAAFLLVSWSSRECGSVFGAHRIHRWTGRAWRALPAPPRPVLKLMATAGVEHSQGPGIVICDENAVGGGCNGNYTLLARVARNASTPVGQRISTRLVRPMFGFARSGVAFALGGDDRDDRGHVALERFRPGSAGGEVIKLPGQRCQAVGLHVFDERDVVVGAVCETSPSGQVLRFDGRAFRPIDVPVGGRAAALTGEPDGTLWLATADEKASRVVRRTPQGEQTVVPLPRSDAANPKSAPFVPSRLVVRGEDVWAIGEGVLYARRADFDAP